MKNSFWGTKTECSVRRSFFDHFFVNFGCTLLLAQPLKRKANEYNDNDCSPQVQWLPTTGPAFKLIFVQNKNACENPRILFSREEAWKKHGGGLSAQRSWIRTLSGGIFHI